MNYKLEHSDEVLTNVHPTTACKGEYCTIHNMSDHSMRSFPQHWRSDRGIMERTCPHGIGHPDTDDPTTDRIHGCDGCCGDRPPVPEYRPLQRDSTDACVEDLLLIEHLKHVQQELNAARMALAHTEIMLNRIIDGRR